MKFYMDYYFLVVKRGQAKYCQVCLMSVNKVRYRNLKPGSYKTGHYAIPFCPSKSKEIFVRDLISLFFLTHENNEIKSPTKIYDFTVYSLNAISYNSNSLFTNITCHLVVLYRIFCLVLWTVFHCQ